MANGGIIGTVNNPTSSTATGVWQQEEQYEAVRDGTWPSRALFTTKSLRFNSGSSDYLSKTFSTTGNRQKFTLSMWIKRGIVPVGNQSGTEGMLFQAFQNSSNQDQIWLQSNGTINYVRNNANAVTPSQVLRDSSAWYHLVFAGDTTQGSNANRLKVYVNGTQAPIGQGDTIAQNSNFGAINNAQSYTFGKRNSNDWYFDGSMSHIHMVDGTAYPASTFGSVDSVTGEWKINTSPSVTYGNNGFFILKDGNSVTDQSGKNNNFSVGGGALTNTKDCPSNVFATLNPLDNFYANATFSYGNTQIVSPSGREASSSSTLAMTKGKFYWETKFLSSNAPFVGIQPIPSFNNTASAAVLQLHGLGLLKTGKVETTNGSGGSTVLAQYATFTTNDIIGVALDLDASQKKIYFYKNGSILGASGVNITDPASTRDGHYMVAVGNISGSDTIAVNFGNGYFATTAITTNSGNGYAGAEGASKFAYQPRSGHSALSTKGLNQ